MQAPRTAAPAPLVRFTCARSRLHHALSLVSHAVSKNSIDIEKMPLLGCLRLEVKDGFLIVAATDLNISITDKIELTKKDEIQEGVVAVPARLFADLVGKMRDGDVKCTVRPDYMLHVEHARGQSTVKCMNAEMYMPIPQAEDGELHVLLPVGGLKGCIREVGVAASRDDGTPVLTCILVHVDNNKLTFAATDRYRTAHRPLLLPTSSQVSYDLLIPQRSLLELSASLPADGMVEMSLTPNRGQAIFHTQWLTFSSRLMEGVFPNYAAAIPKKEDRKTRVVVKTDEFKEIVQLTAPYANAGDSGVICLTVKGSQGMELGRLTAASEPTEVGEGKNYITAVVEGDDLEDPINFNCKLLLEVLNVIPTPDVSLEIGVMRVKNHEGESISAPAGVLKAVGQHPCVHSFMSLASSQ